MANQATTTYKVTTSPRSAFLRPFGSKRPEVERPLCFAKNPSLGGGQA